MFTNTTKRKKCNTTTTNRLPSAPSYRQTIAAVSTINSALPVLHPSSALDSGFDIGVVSQRRGRILAKVICSGTTVVISVVGVRIRRVVEIFTPSSNVRSMAWIQILTLTSCCCCCRCCSNTRANWSMLIRSPLRWTIITATITTRTGTTSSILHTFTVGISWIDHHSSCVSRINNACYSNTGISNSSSNSCSSNWCCILISGDTNIDTWIDCGSTSSATTTYTLTSTMRTLTTIHGTLTLSS